MVDGNGKTKGRENRKEEMKWAWERKPSKN